ncbi:MAG: S-layer homology domain-containing protein [Candidatus Ornithomonoglobus sp.]
MKKKIFGCLITAAVMSVTFAASQTMAAQYSDVDSGHWAYGYISELSDKNVINGMEDGTFRPENKVTREQFMKLLVCALNCGSGEGGLEFSDVEPERWSYTYIQSGVTRGIFSPDEYFNPDGELTREIAAEWMVNGVGVSGEYENPFTDMKSDTAQGKAVGAAYFAGLVTGYEDGTYRPENTITRAEASAMIKRIMEYKDSLFSKREDSENKIVLQDNVKVASSVDSVNVPVSADEKAKTVTFSKADEAVKGLEKGDILYIPPSRNFPAGLAGKVVSVKTSGSNTVVAFEDAAVNELVKSIDISTMLAVSPECYGSGDLRAKSMVKAAKAVESGENGVEFNEKADGGTDIDVYWDGLLPDVDTSLYGNLTETARIHFETDGYAKRKGFYAATDATLTALVDVQMETNNLDITKLDAKAEVKTDIDATAGYSNSISKEKRFSLPDAEVPIAGVLKLVINSELVAKVDGSVTIEATANLDSLIGVSYSLQKGIEANNYAEAQFALNADAEGSLSLGPEESIKLTTVGITIPVLNKTILEGADLLQAKGYAGIKVYGKTELEKTASVSFGKQDNEEELSDEKHDCNFCVQGDIKRQMNGSCGLGDDVQELVNKITDKEFTAEWNPDDVKLDDWYLSDKDGFKIIFDKCPHYSYKTLISVIDDNGAGISGANVNVDGNNYTTDQNGNVTAYLENGKYSVVAAANGRDATEAELEITDKPTELEIRMESDLKVMPFSRTQVYKRLRYGTAEMPDCDVYLDLDMSGDELCADYLKSGDVFDTVFAIVDDYVYYSTNVANIDIQPSIWRCRLDGSGITKLTDLRAPAHEIYYCNDYIYYNSPWPDYKLMRYGIKSGIVETLSDKCYYGGDVIGNYAYYSYSNTTFDEDYYYCKLNLATGEIENDTEYGPYKRVVMNKKGKYVYYRIGSNFYYNTLDLKNEKQISKMEMYFYDEDTMFFVGKDDNIYMHKPETNELELLPGLKDVSFMDAYAGNIYYKTDDDSCYRYSISDKKSTKVY